jgi:hypothetical protein
MIDRIGRAVGTTDNGDFVADNATLSGLATVALKPLTGHGLHPDSKAGESSYSNAHGSLEFRC